jgi:antitoxin FitA
MGQVLIRNLDDALIADYREAARRNQRSLEAELREALARVRPAAVKDGATLVALARQLRARTLPAGKGQDSVPWIRWDRDTDHGRHTDGFTAPDDAGR